MSAELVGTWLEKGRDTSRLQRETGERSHNSKFKGHEWPDLDTAWTKRYLCRARVKEKR
jgi:hypothetical protein